MPLGPAPSELRYCFERDADGKSCTEQAISRGLCRRHYQRRWNKDQLPTKPKRKKTVSFTIRIPEDMHAALSKQSRATGRPLAQLAEMAISGALQNFGLWPPKEKK